MKKPKDAGSESRLAYTTRQVDSNPASEPLTPARQQLTLQRRRISGGKWVVEVRGFTGRLVDLEALARQLKAACAVGGTVKDDTILLQGDCIEKAMAFLQNKGHHVKRSGG
jgi:translation initiation factor 1